MAALENKQIERLVTNYIDTYRESISVNLGEKQTPIEVCKEGDAFFLPSDDPRVLEATRDPREVLYDEYYRSIGLRHFISALHLEGHALDSTYDFAEQRLTIIYYEEKLKRALRLDPMNNEELQAIYRELSKAYFKLSKNATVANEVDLKTVREKSEWQEKGVEYLRRCIGLNDPDQARPSLEDLEGYASEFLELSTYFDANGFNDPKKKVSLILEAIKLLETAINSIDDRVKLARLYLLISDYYYHVAMIYRDEFPDRDLEARSSFQKAKSMRDAAKTPGTPRASPMSPRTVSMRVQIDKLVRTSDRQHELLEAEVPAVEKPRATDPNPLEETADLFVGQRRRDDTFKLFLSAFKSRFKPLTCMVALYEMHREGNRAMENNDFLQGMNRFEVFIASKVNELDDNALKKLYRDLTSAPVVNLINGLLFYYRCYDRLGLKFDCNNIETAMSSNAGKLHDMMKKTLSIVKFALLLRDKNVTSENGVLKDAGDIPDGVVLKMQYANQRAFTKVMDSINKGKIALLPKELGHTQSYRKVVQSFRYIFKPQKLNESLWEMHERLAQAHREVNDAEGRTDLVKQYLKSALGLTTTNELLWLYKKLSSRSVQHYIAIIGGAQVNAGKRNKASIITPERLNFLNAILKDYQEKVRSELTKRGFETKPFLPVVRKAVNVTQSSPAILMTH